MVANMVKVASLLIVCVLFSCSQNVNDKRSVYEVAEENINKKEIAEMISVLTAEMSLSNKRTDLLVKRGLYYCKLRKYEEAIYDFHEAIKLDSTYNEAYFGLGFVFLNKGIYEQFMPDKSINSDSILSRSMYENALSYFNTVINNDDNISPVVFAQRGLCNEMLNEYDAALSDYGKAIKIGGQVNHYLARALLFFKVDSVEKGNDDFESAIEISDKKLDLYFLKAFTNAEHGNAHEAIEDYTWLIKNDSSQGYSHYYERAKLYEILDSNLLALKDLKAISKIDSSITFHNFEIAALYAKINYFDSSYVYIKKAHVLDNIEKRNFLDDIRFKKIIDNKQFNAIFN